MALIVEDGTGIEDADALVSVELVDDYAERYGKTEGWDVLSETRKEELIRQASLFINSKYSIAAPPLHSYQSFAFPAVDFYVRTHLVEGMPVQVKNATAELALMARTIDLVDSLIARNYIYRRVNAAGVEKEERWAEGDSPQQKPFALIEMIMAPILSSLSGMGGVNIVRLRPGA